MLFRSLDMFYTDNVWHHVLFSSDTNHDEGLKKAKFYVDDVDASDFFFDLGLAFQNTYNGLGFFIGSANSLVNFFRGDMADLWMAPGVSILDGSGDIPESTRRKFISSAGKPVNPAGWPDAPMKFYGDSSSFPVNKGTGGDFTVTGAFTDASTSPSD